MLSEDIRRQLEKGEKARTNALNFEKGVVEKPANTVNPLPSFMQSRSSVELNRYAPDSAPATDQESELSKLGQSIDEFNRERTLKQNSGEIQVPTSTGVMDNIIGSNPQFQFPVITPKTFTTPTSDKILGLSDKFKPSVQQEELNNFDNQKSLVPADVQNYYQQHPLEIQQEQPIKHTTESIADAKTKNFVNKLGLSGKPIGNIIESIIRPIAISYQQIDEAKSHLSKSSPTGILKEITDLISTEDYPELKSNGEGLRGIGKLATGGIGLGLSAIPGVVALNAFTPVIDDMAVGLAKKFDKPVPQVESLDDLDGIETAAKIQKDNAQRQETYREIAHTIMPFIFGKWVGAGSLTSKIVDKAIEASGVLKNMNEDDQKVVRELAQNLVFFTTTVGGQRFEKNLEKNVNDGLEEIFGNEYKPGLSFGTPLGRGNTPLNAERIPIYAKGKDFENNSAKKIYSKLEEKFQNSEFAKNNNVEGFLSNYPAGPERDMYRSKWADYKDQKVGDEDFFDYLDRIEGRITPKDLNKIVPGTENFAEQTAEQPLTADPRSRFVVNQVEKQVNDFISKNQPVPENIVNKDVIDQVKDSREMNRLGEIYNKLLEHNKNIQVGGQNAGQIRGNKTINPEATSELDGGTSQNQRREDLQRNEEAKRTDIDEQTGSLPAQEITEPVKQKLNYIPQYVELKDGFSAETYHNKHPQDIWRRVNGKIRFYPKDVDENLLDQTLEAERLQKVGTERENLGKRIAGKEPVEKDLRGQIEEELSLSGIKDLSDNYIKALYKNKKVLDSIFGKRDFRINSDAAPSEKRKSLSIINRATEELRRQGIDANYDMDGDNLLVEGKKVFPRTKTENENLFTSQIRNDEAAKPFSKLGLDEVDKQSFLAEVISQKNTLPDDLAKMLPSGFGQSKIDKGLKDIKEDGGREQSIEAQQVRDFAKEVEKRINKDGFITFSDGSKFTKKDYETALEDYIYQKSKTSTGKEDVSFNPADFEEPQKPIEEPTPIPEEDFLLGTPKYAKPFTQEAKKNVEENLFGIKEKTIFDNPKSITEKYPGVSLAGYDNDKGEQYKGINKIIAEAKDKRIESIDFGENGIYNTIKVSVKGARPDSIFDNVEFHTTNDSEAKSFLKEIEDYTGLKANSVNKAVAKQEEKPIEQAENKPVEFPKVADVPNMSLSDWSNLWDKFENQHNEKISSIDNRIKLLDPKTDKQKIAGLKEEKKKIQDAHDEEHFNFGNSFNEYVQGEAKKRGVKLDEDEYYEISDEVGLAMEHEVYSEPKKKVKEIIDKVIGDYLEKQGGAKDKELTKELAVESKVQISDISSVEKEKGTGVNLPEEKSQTPEGKKLYQKTYNEYFNEQNPSSAKSQERIEQFQKDNYYQPTQEGSSFEDVIKEKGGKILNVKNLGRITEDYSIGEKGLQQDALLDFRGENFEYKYELNGETRYGYVRSKRPDVDVFAQEWFTTDKKLSNLQVYQHLEKLGIRYNQLIKDLFDKRERKDVGNIMKEHFYAIKKAEESGEYIPFRIKNSNAEYWRQHPEFQKEVDIFEALKRSGYEKLRDYTTEEYTKKNKVSVERQSKLKKQLNDIEDFLIKYPEEQPKFLSKEVFNKYPELKLKFSEKPSQGQLTRTPKEGVQNINPTKETSPITKTAYELGEKAFEEGKKAVPIHDKNFVKLLEDSNLLAGTKEGVAQVEAWTKGWHETRELQINERLDKYIEQYIKSNGLEKTSLDKRGIKGIKDYVFSGTSVIPTLKDIQTVHQKLVDQEIEKHEKEKEKDNEPETNKGVTVRKNEAQNGVEIKFDNKPTPEVIAKLKHNGFRWSIRNHVWYSHFSDSKMAWAQKEFGPNEDLTKDIEKGNLSEGEKNNDAQSIVNGENGNSVLPAVPESGVPEDEGKRNAERGNVKTGEYDDGGRTGDNEGIRANGGRTGGDVGLGESERGIPSDVDFHHTENTLRSFEKLFSSQASKLDANIRAIKLLAKINSEKRLATFEEKVILSRYTGWGGLKSVFDPKNKNYKEIKDLLSPDEYKQARSSIRNAHYTAPNVVKGIYDLVKKLGFTGGVMVEPAMGNGIFFSLMPEDIKPSSKLGIDKDGISAAISKLLYPESTIEHKGFEEVYIPEGSVDLFISNVPFGQAQLIDMFDKNKYYGQVRLSIHNFFFAKALDKVKPNGLVVFITSRYTMDSVDKGFREYLSSAADLVGAIRLPSSAFKGIANTEVVSDILIFKKKRGEELNKNLDWIDSVPLRYDNNENKYFADHPENVLGTVEYTGSMYKEKEYTVTLPEEAIAERLKEVISKFPENILQETKKEVGDKIDSLLADLDTDIFAEKATEYQGALDKPAAESSKEAKLKQILLTYFDSSKTDFDEIVKDLRSRLGDKVDKITKPLKAIYDEYMKDKTETIFVKDTDNVKKNGFAVIDFQPYQRIGDQLVKVDLKNKKDLVRIRGFVELKEAYNKLINWEEGEPEDSVKLENLRKATNNIYDRFILKNGHLHSSANYKVLDADPDFYKLLGLESVEMEGRKVIGFTKAQILKSRVLYPNKKIGEIQNVKDALIVSLNEANNVDVKRIAGLLGTDEKTVSEELIKEGLVFKYRDRFIPSDEYLSGDVVTKLEEAKELAKSDPATYNANVEALKAVLPERKYFMDLNPFMRLGLAYVPTEVYSKFFNDFFDGKVNVTYNETTGKFFVSGKSVDNTKINNEFSVRDVDGYDLFENALNGTYPKFYLKDPVSKQSYPDENSNNQAVALIRQLHDAFRTHVNEKADSQKIIEDHFNDRYNRMRARTFDGNHLWLPGLTQKLNGRDFTLYPHQKNAVHRILQPKNVLLAHTMGAGKTASMIISGMELKRLGLGKRIMYIVPKSILYQFPSEFNQLYPKANVLFPRDKDFEPATRKEFLSKILSQDWDAIIISHGQFGKIPLGADKMRDYYSGIMDEFDEMINELESESDGSRSFTREIKRLENLKDNYEAKLIEIANKADKDETIPFDELGVDHLFVDESHLFKNLYLPTSHGSVKGIGTSLSGRAVDLAIKTDFLRKKYGHGIVFATGTPVANALTEFLVVQRYLQPESLKDFGVYNLDSWLNTFGKISDDIEVSVAGQLKQQTRLRNVENLRQLMPLYGEVADIVTDEDLKKVAPIPKLKDGKRTIVEVDMIPEYTEYVQRLISRAENLPKDKTVDNMLKITGDGRKASVDMRLVGGKDSPNSKVNKLVEMVYLFWDKTKNKKTTQLIRLDQGVAGGSNYDLYNDIKTKLRDAGIPESDIAFVQDYDTPSKKSSLFKQINRGNIRIVIGSTETVGVGVNMQERLGRLYHVDLPYRPDQLLQAEKRMLRPGNSNDEVEIVVLLNKADRNQRVYPFDAYQWQLLQNKEIAYEGAMNKNPNVDTISDSSQEALSFAELRALATNNPELIEFVRLRGERGFYESLYRNYLRKKERDQYLISGIPERISFFEKTQSDYEKDIKNFPTKPEDVKITLFGEPIKSENKTYTTEEESKKAFVKDIKEYLGKVNWLSFTGTIPIGNVNGKFTLSAGRTIDTLRGSGDEGQQGIFEEVKYHVQLVSNETGRSYEYKFSEVPQLNFSRIVSIGQEAQESIVQLPVKIKSLEKELEDLKKIVEKPFDQEKKLAEINDRLTQLEATLGRDNPTEVAEDPNANKDDDDEDDVEDDFDMVKEAGLAYQISEKGAEYNTDRTELQKLQDYRRHLDNVISTGNPGSKEVLSALKQVKEVDKRLTVLHKKEASAEDLNLFGKESKLVKRSSKEIAGIFGNEEKQKQTKQEIQEAFDFSRVLGKEQGEISQFNDNRSSYGGVSDYRSVKDEWKETGTVVFTGRQLSPENYIQDIGDLHNALRNPFTETSLFEGLDKNKKIVGTVVISSNASDFVNITPRHQVDAIGYLIKKGATEIISSHNHPSGNAEPSPDDFVMHEKLSALIDKLVEETGADIKLGEAVVVNGDKFSHWKAGDKKAQFSEYVKPEKNLNQEWYNKYGYTANPQIRSIDDAAKYFAGMKYGNGMASVVTVDSGNRVRGWEVVPVSIFDKSAEEVSKELENILKRVGGDSVFIIKAEEGLPKAISVPKNLTSDYTLRIYTQTIVFKDGKAYDVQEYYSSTGDIGPADISFREKQLEYNKQPQTETPEFKKFFGDSIVKDEKGNPLIVNHGTTENFDAFKVGDIGYHFGTIHQANQRTLPAVKSGRKPLVRYEKKDGVNKIEEVTSEGANVIPAYLRLEHPLRINDNGLSTPIDYANEIKDAGEHGLIDKSLSNDIYNHTFKILKGGDWDVPKKDEAYQYMREKLKEAGFDGLVYENKFENKYSKDDSYVVFDSNQIKSAVGNSGEFDRQNESLVAAKREEYNATTGGLIQNALETKMFDSPGILSDNIVDYAKNHQAGKRLGLYDGVTSRIREAKLTLAYNELLTAPVWYFDKHPELSSIWNIIDKNFVRDINEDVADLTEDFWKKGEPYRKLSKENKEKVLKAFDSYIIDLYEERKYGGFSTRLRYDQFISKYGLDNEAAEFINNTYRPLREKMIDLLTEKDFYLIVNTNTNRNPFLEGMEGVRGSKERVAFIRNAKEEFFNADPQAEEVFNRELSKLDDKEDDVAALNNAWASSIILRQRIGAELVEQKYDFWRDKVEIPTSRLDHKFYIGAYKPFDETDRLIYNIKIPAEKYFGTAENEQQLEELKKMLLEKGFEADKINYGRFDQLRENILDNDVTEEDVVDLFNNTNIDLNSDIAQKLLKNIQAKGFERHFIPKQYIPGFKFSDENFEKTIFRQINGLPNYTHKIIGLNELQNEMAFLKKKGVLTDGSNQDKYVTHLRNQLDASDADYLRAVRTAASTMYLSLRPSYYIQQAVQPFNTLLPYLPVIEKELGISAGSGEVAFLRAIGEAHPFYLAKMINKMFAMAGKKVNLTFGLDKEFLDVMRRMERQGVAKPLRSMEMLGEQVDPKKHYSKNLYDGYDIGKFNVGIYPLLKLFSIPGIAIEDFTRVIGLRALYLMAKKANLSGTRLEQFLSTNIAKTYGPASGRQSRPPGYNVASKMGFNQENFGTKLARAFLNSITIFKNFAFMNYGQWGKLWRAMFQDKSIRGMVYKVAGSVGVTGLRMMMWVSTIMFLARMVYGIINRAKDPEEDVRDFLKLADKILPGAGEVLDRGAAFAMGLDLSNLFSQQAPFISEDVAFKGNLGDAVGGVPVAVGKDVAKAISEKDAMNVAPTGIRNLRKADEMEKKGVKWNTKILIPSKEEYDKKIAEGDTTYKNYVENSDVLAKKMGFTTSKISAAYEDERFRDFRNKQMGDVVRDRVNDTIVPLIQSDKSEEAEKELEKLYQEVLEGNVLTKNQKESIYGLSSFVSQYVLARVRNEDSYDVMKEFQSNVFGRRGRGRSRVRSSRRFRD